MDARRYILQRRGAGIAKLQTMNMENGDSTLEQAASAGYYRVNCTHHVGIATSTEVALSADRFVVRVLLRPPAATYPKSECHTVVSYWRVGNEAGIPIPFSRKPLASDIAVRNLYKIVPGFDDMIWDAYSRVRENVADFGRSAEEEDQRHALYEILQMINPTAEQLAMVPTILEGLVSAAVAANRHVWVKIEDNTYIIGDPHGTEYSPVGKIDANRVALMETMLCASINYTRLKAKYDTVSERLINVAAFSIASMFRMGLQESYEHKEYYTVYMSPVEGSSTQFMVDGIAATAGVPAPSDIQKGSVVDIKSMKMKANVIELANSCVIGSGLMHYQFNHTTGGTIICGTLLTTLSMYKLITTDMAPDMQLSITNVLYEALHPTNKRAIANIFFKNTGVTTAGRCSHSCKFERFQLNSFMTIRSNNLYPAGAHKAFICMQALKRVLQAGLGPFLPWADQLSTCIQTCKEVLQAGARAHVGSSYYTGEPPRAQPASIDTFLPELAQYVNTFNRGDGLFMTPHMAYEIGKRSNMNWQNLLKELRSKDVSATSVDTSGSVHFKFDPKDQATWGKAMADANVALESINNVFN